MSTSYKNERKPAGWSLVAGKFRGTDKTYFYVVRGHLMCELPLTLRYPTTEDGYTYSNPFTITDVFVRFGAHIDQEAIQKLGKFSLAKRDLRILVGDELRNVTASYPWNDIVFERKAGSKLRAAVDDWERTWIGEAANKVEAAAKEANVMEGEQKKMGMNCNCKNEGTSALSEVLLYWHDEVHDRIGEIIGKETNAVHEASTKKVFVERMAAEIVEFEREGAEATVEFEVMAAKRAEYLRSLLMDWVKVPKSEYDKVVRLECMRKDALARLEEEFESLVVRSKIVKPENAESWLRAVGVYGSDGLDFDVEGDARRFVGAVSAKV